MESLIIAPTDQTFGIHFDTTSGEFEIKGRCLPENITAFFQPVIDWVNKFVEEAPRSVHITFDVDYFHTATMKLLMELFNAFERLDEKGHKVSITWRFHEDDGDMEDTGMELADIVKLPFKLVSFSD